MSTLSLLLLLRYIHNIHRRNCRPIGRWASVRVKRCSSSTWRMATLVARWMSRPTIYNSSSYQSCATEPRTAIGAPMSCRTNSNAQVSTHWSDLVSTSIAVHTAALDRRTQTQSAKCHRQLRYILAYLSWQSAEILFSCWGVVLTLCSRVLVHTHHPTTGWSLSEWTPINYPLSQFNSTSSLPSLQMIVTKKAPRARMVFA